jgi:hypothetical protein
LAALPTTLFFLLEEFREVGHFRGSHRELYERGCGRLAREVDPRRMETLRQLRKTARVSTPQEVYEAAARLATLLLVCGKSAIHAGPLDEADVSDLHVSEATDNTLMEYVILDAISTGLFTSRGPDRFGFAHQTFAECLAARLLVRLPLVQLRSLFCARDHQDEHVVPQLAETASWVACEHTEFFDHICKIEPEVLLRSDVSKVQNHRKSALVAAVLEKAKRGDLFDERNISRFFETLKHPSLSVQLQSFIRDKSLHTVVRRMAMRIAGDCKEINSFDILMQVVRDSGEEQHIRDQAAHSLESLIPKSRLAELVPLALGHVGGDPDDDIRGCAIRRLVPEHWSVSKALPAIRAPRNTHFYGAYWSLLHYYLPQHLKDADVPLVLARMIRWTHCFDSLSWFEELAEATFAKALKNLENKAIRKLAVRVWVVKQQRHHPLPHSKDSQVVKLLEANVELRRGFIAAILNDVDTPADDFHTVNGFQISLFLRSDFEWALEQIRRCPVERRAAWANIIWRACNPDSACLCWDLLLKRIGEIPELKEKFEWLRAWSLDEPIARKAKADWLKEQRWKREADRPRRDLDVEEMIKSVLADIATGKTHRWIQLCDLLSLEEDQTAISHPLDYDMTEFPGWKAADEARRKEIRAAGRRFLLEHSDGFEQIGGRTNYFDPGHIAIWLLRSELRHDNTLKFAVASKWIEALIGHCNDGSDHYQETAALAYELNPDKVIHAFIREVQEDDKKHGQIICLNGFRKAWDSKFTEVAIDLVRKGNLKPESIESLIAFLSPIAPTDVAICANELLAPASIADPNLRNRTIGVLAACIGAVPANTWNFAWPIIESDPELAEDVLLRASDRFDYDRKRFLPSLTEAQLADLYFKLRKLFPPETDPPRNSGFSGVSPRQAVSWFRGDVITALEARGTEAACRELLRLAKALPEEGVWLQWRLYNARLSKRRMSWSPPAPQTVLMLAKWRHGRLVRDADDLLEVVVESLGRFQTQLSHSTLPRSEVLWRWDGSDTQRHNFHPRDEAFLCDEIARWLRDDLNQRGVVIGREVQPRRGQRTDIYVEAIAGRTADTALQNVTVVIEVKGCWNPDMKTAADSQLVGDYLRPNGLTHGIYLIGWFICDKWQKPRNELSSETVNTAREEVNQLVGLYDGKSNPERVAGLVLDCRCPA